MCMARVMRVLDAAATPGNAYHVAFATLCQLLRFSRQACAAYRSSSGAWSFLQAPPGAGPGLARKCCVALLVARGGGETHLVRVVVPEDVAPDPACWGAAGVTAFDALCCRAARPECWDDAFSFERCCVAGSPGPPGGLLALLDPEPATAPVFVEIGTGDRETLAEYFWRRSKEEGHTTENLGSIWPCIVDFSIMFAGAISPFLNKNP